CPLHVGNQIIRSIGHICLAGGDTELWQWDYLLALLQRLGHASCGSEPDTLGGQHDPWSKEPEHAGDLGAL
ncbi:hypothetical protein ACJX0J_012025, partial [Zea mays]